MKKNITYTSEIDSFSNLSEVPSEFQQLIVEAQKTLESSYSPYSGFSVGAAIKLANGKIVFGSNQENIAYPSGLCAERVAIFSAGTNFPNEEITAIAITAKSLHGKVTSPVTPCGGCRQVMIEVESKQGHPITVIMVGESGEIWITKSVANLIPFYFSSPVVGKVE